MWSVDPAICQVVTALRRAVGESAVARTALLGREFQGPGGQQTLQRLLQWVKGQLMCRHRSGMQTLGLYALKICKLGWH